MGNRRSAVTESDEIDYALPAATLLQRGKGDPGPDVRDREAVAKSLWTRSVTSASRRSCWGLSAAPT